MFRVRSTETGKSYRLAIAGLLTLSVAALAVTIWVMNDLLREQEIVAELIEYLPPEGDVAAEELAGELRWQFRLSILVVLNLVVTGFTVLLLWRAYRSSQDSLRDIKALAGDILGSMDQAVITTDVSGIVTSINRRGVELLRLSSEHVGGPLSELSQQLSLEELRQQTRSLEKTKQARDIQLASNGSTKTLRAFCQPLHDHENADIGNVIQLRDVTERVLMDDRMRRMERYMGLGSLAAGLHHEIKNPLAALSLHVQLMEEELMEGEASQSVLEMLGVIKTEVARVGGVLEGFRDFASVGRLNLADVDLVKLIDRQVRLIGPQAETQGIDVQVKLPAGPLPTVRVDRVRLEQVLLNLMINAMEAMPDGGTIEVRASIVRQETRNSVRIEIIDMGPGVPENLRSRIFDPYFTTKGEGTGMGLALCDKIIRQHHGLLDFHSTEHGSVFDITLPIE
jgi:two-component system sensor histidine kinase HydH